MQMKSCSRCKRELPADNCHFYPASNTKDKLHSACKECEKHKFSKPKIKVKEGYKICTGCYKELPATKEYFYGAYGEKSSKSGLAPKCKECSGHSFGIFEINKVIDGYKVCTKCKRNLPYTKEYFYSSGDNLRTVCKECQSEISKNQYNEDIYSKRDYARKWYYKNLADNEEHKIKNRIKSKQHRLKIQHTQHYKDVQIEKSQRRRAIKKKLLSTYTKEQWDECKNYFNHQCAYCGKKFPLSQDHIIPVTKGGGYIKQNIIPACKSCNSSKSNKDMETWYKSQTFFSEERLAKIYKWMGVKDNIQQLKII